MSRVLRISITFLFALICTTTAQTSEAPPLAPKCEGDICYCVPGTHEAVFNGRKFCETDSTESCPEHAIRLSAQVCECKKGYRYLNNERKVCIPEHMQPPVIPADADEEDMDSKTAKTETTSPTTTTTQRINIPTTTQATTATTPTTTNNTTTSTKLERSEESETSCNKFYITVGIVVLVITALILIALLWLLYKR